MYGELVTCHYVLGDMPAFPTPNNYSQKHALFLYNFCRLHKNALVWPPDPLEIIPEASKIV